MIESGNSSHTVMPHSDAADSAPRLFISYSRADGSAFAKDFQRRIAAEGLTSWRDLTHMKGGENILPQALSAVEAAEHLVLILTPRALASNWVKREWIHARRHGTRVSPILAAEGMKKRDLPPWMARSDVYDISDPERWTQLLSILKGEANVRRVPYAKVHLPDNFVPRAAEFDRLKSAILEAGATETVAVTAALQGAGGYGKTTLADALCTDEDIMAEFSDGVIRIELGKKREDLLPLISDLIEMLDKKGRRPGYQDVQSAAQRLSEVIGEARLLLVIDDVWREAQLRPFLLDGPNCVRLVTTRNRRLLPENTLEFDVDELTPEEAQSVLSWKLDPTDPEDRRLNALAAHLENWAQMLEIANGWLRGRLRQDETLTSALDRFERRLAKRGLIGFDPREEGQRNRAIGICVGASLEDLGTDIERFEELGILPEDENVPLSVISAFWDEVAHIDEDEAEDLIAQVADLSLLQRLDLGKTTVRLHDNMIWLLRDRMGPQRTRAMHRAMADALLKRAGSDFKGWSDEASYAWKHLIWHLRQSGAEEEADALLVDPSWFLESIETCGAQETFAQFVPPPNDQSAQLLGRALGLSVPALSDNPAETYHQLEARLRNSEHAEALSRLLKVLANADESPVTRVWGGPASLGLEVLRLVGHESEVPRAVYSHCGTRIITGSDDGTVRLWDAEKGVELAALQAHERGVRDVAISQDDTRIVTSSFDGTARLWDAETGDELSVLLGHVDVVWNVAFSPDGTSVVTCSEDGTVRFWDTKSGLETGILCDCKGSVRTVAFSPDGTRLVTGLGDGTARLWDIKSGLELCVLRGHEGVVLSSAFCPKGVSIATSSFDDTVRLWDAVDGKELCTLRGHESSVRSVAYSPDGDWVATGSEDGTVRLWDANNGAEISVFHCFEGIVWSAAFSPDGTRIVTGSGSGLVRIWDVANAAGNFSMRGHRSFIRSVSFSPNGTRILTDSDDGTARLWDAESASEVNVWRGRTNKVSSAAFSPDGKCIAAGFNDGGARLWDAASGVELGALQGHSEVLISIAFSPDGKRIVTASYDRTARIWDAESQAVIAVLRGHDGWLRNVAFSPDGQRVVTGSYDKTARIWNTETGLQLNTLRGHDGWLRSPTFSPQGNLIATSSYDQTARIWAVESGAEIAVLRGHTGDVRSVAFSPDGKCVVTGSRDGTARVWDAESGAEIGVLRGHDDWLDCACFSADGETVVTISYDNTTRFWNAKSLRVLATLSFDARITAIALSDGQIAFGDSLGGLHRYCWKKPDSEDVP